MVNLRLMISLEHEQQQLGKYFKKWLCQCTSNVIKNYKLPRVYQKQGLSISEIPSISSKHFW